MRLAINLLIADGLSTVPAAILGYNFADPTVRVRLGCSVLLEYLVLLLVYEIGLMFIAIHFYNFIITSSNLEIIINHKLNTTIFIF